MRVVLSGVNLVELGPLSIFRDALQSLTALTLPDLEIIALVNSKKLFPDLGVRFIEFPDIGSSWIRRLKFEYFDLRSLSTELQADLWLSLHDVTPNIVSRRRAVYCHCPAPFYSLRVQDAYFSWQFAVFVAFYSLLYRVNIKKNDLIIVQQDWLRHEFQQRYAARNVVVAHPVLNEAGGNWGKQVTRGVSGPVRFFYPAFPRPFKNFEVVLEAAARLESMSETRFELWITLAGSINRYSRWLYRKYKHLRTVHWLGMLSRDEVFRSYLSADCMIFPSKLETWGLPITEFKGTGRPILLADLPYAHETIGSYDKVAWFPPDDADALAKLMRGIIQDQDITVAVRQNTIEPPFAMNWTELWGLLLNGLTESGLSNQRPA